MLIHGLDSHSGGTNCDFMHTIDSSVCLSFQLAFLFIQFYKLAHGCLPRNTAKRYNKAWITFMPLMVYTYLGFLAESPCRSSSQYVSGCRVGASIALCTFFSMFGSGFRSKASFNKFCIASTAANVRLALFKQSLGLLCRTMTDQIILLQIVVQETSNKHARHDFLQKSSTFQHDTSKTFVFSPKIEYW